MYRYKSGLRNPTGVSIQFVRRSRLYGLLLLLPFLLFPEFVTAYTYEVKATVSLSPGGAINAVSPGALVTDETGRWAYVANGGSRSLSIVDLVEGHVQNLQLPLTPSGLLRDDLFGRLLIWGNLESRLLVLRDGMGSVEILELPGSISKLVLAPESSFYVGAAESGENLVLIERESLWTSGLELPASLREIRGEPQGSLYFVFFDEEKPLLLQTDAGAGPALTEWTEDETEGLPDVLLYRLEKNSVWIRQPDDTELEVELPGEGFEIQERRDGSGPLISIPSRDSLAWVKTEEENQVREIPLGTDLKTSTALSSKGLLAGCDGRGDVLIIDTVKGKLRRKIGIPGGAHKVISRGRPSDLLVINRSGRLYRVHGQNYRKKTEISIDGFVEDAIHDAKRNRTWVSTRDGHVLALEGPALKVKTAGQVGKVRELLLGPTTGSLVAILEANGLARIPRPDRGPTLLLPEKTWLEAEFVHPEVLYMRAEGEAAYFRFRPGPGKLERFDLPEIPGSMVLLSDSGPLYFISRSRPFLYAVDIRKGEISRSHRLPFLPGSIAVEASERVVAVGGAFENLIYAYRAGEAKGDLLKMGMTPETLFSTTGKGLVVFNRAAARLSWLQRSKVRPAILIGSGQGGESKIRWFLDEDRPAKELIALRDRNPEGGITVAAGDVDGDGFDEAVVGTTEGGESSVEVITWEGKRMASFEAFDGNNLGGGVRLAAGDLDGDDRYEIVIGEGEGGLSRIQIALADGTIKTTFRAFEPDENPGGAISVAVGDVNGDGRNEIVVGQGTGRGSRLRVFSSNGTELWRTEVFEDAGSKDSGIGIHVAAGDFDGDGIDEIAAGHGRGGSSVVRVFEFRGSLLAELSVFGEANSEGEVRLGAVDIDADGEEELLAAHGRKGRCIVRVLKLSGESQRSFVAFDEKTSEGDAWLCGFRFPRGR